MFIFGALLISLLIVVFSLGMKTYFRIQNILIIFAMISTVLTVAVFIGKVPADVIHAFNDYLGAVSGKTDPAAYVRGVGQGGRLHRAGALLADRTLLVDDLDLPEPVLHVLLRLHRQ